MGYADHVRSTPRPSCWGNTLSYDASDPECADCRFHHSCSTDVSRKEGRVHVTEPRYRRTNYKSQNDTDYAESGVNKPAVVEPKERPVERFAKDAVGGGLRGMFYEMWQFWRHYRIR